MKCKHCNKNVIRIKTAGGNMVCNAEPVLYWHSKNPNASVLTPTGETMYCKLHGNPNTAHGMGYTLHTCFQEEPHFEDTK